MVYLNVFILIVSVCAMCFVSGGWQVLKDFTLAEWDKTRTLVQLHAQYSVSPFLKVDVVPDDKAAGQYIIQV